MGGKLSIVATPIGNLGDITLRALETLRNADLVAAEDTRRTVKLLNHFDIKNKLLSFHEYSDEARYREILRCLGEGKHVALVSDAGTPVISDPGFQLVARCLENGIEVQSLPGACAAITAVTLSGMDCSRFSFYGFLNTKSSARKKELEEMRAAGKPCVIYESPNRIGKTLADVCEVCGEDTPVCVARELTKVYEELLRTTAGEALKILGQRDAVKGEFVLILDPSAQKREVSDEDIVAALRECVLEGKTKKDAVTYVTALLGVSKNRTYQLLLTL